jgi:D-alanyl-D-alanine carboxypeptidase
MANNRCDFISRSFGIVAWDSFGSAWNARNMKVRGLCIAMVALAICASTMPAGAVPIARGALLQRALDQGRIKSGAPGVSAAIFVGGTPVWEGQSGTTDVRVGARVSAQTMFPLASVTKMFVATIAMRLAEGGVLRVDGPIAGLVPAYVQDVSRVTALDLLDHTSGYRDDEDDPAILRLLADPNYAWTRDDLMRREGPVRFAPGSRFRYCNSCYVMLGSVIEHASGATLGELLRRYIGTPLSLNDAVDIDRLDRFAPSISRGYDEQHGKLVDTFVGAKAFGVPTEDWGPVWTDGGIIATASGVARFTDALLGGRLVSSKSLARMLRPDPKNAAASIIESMHMDGRTWRGHSGYYYGFTAESWYDASRRVTITVLANRTDDNDPATEIWDRLVKAYDAQI